MNVPLWLIVGGCVTGGFLWTSIGEPWQKRRKLEKAFSGRSSLSSDDFYTTYFSTSGIDRDVVIKIKEIFHENIGADLSKLSAEDDFSKELKFIWDYDSMASVQIVIDLEKEFNIKITDAEASEMNTLRKVVEIVHAKINSR